MAARKNGSESIVMAVLATVLVLALIAAGVFVLKDDSSSGSSGSSSDEEGEANALGRLVDSFQDFWQRLF